MSDLIDCNNDPPPRTSPARAKKFQGCIATADRPWILLHNSVCEINKHPLSSAPTLLSVSLSIPTPPFHAIILFFRGPGAVTSSDGASTED